MGDVVQIGDATLYHGDCLEILPTLPTLPKVDAVITSPPYDRQREYCGRVVSDWRSLVSGALAPLQWGDAQILVNLGLVHRDGEVVQYWDALTCDMRAAGWRLFGWYVWDQGPGMPGDWNGRLGPAHEFIFHFNKVTRRANKTAPAKYANHVRNKPQGGLRRPDGSMSGWSHGTEPTQEKKIPDSVIRVMRHKHIGGIESGHPAVFPPELPSALAAAYTDNGQTVADPFMGSGTTGVACANLGRKFIGIEIERKYFDIACERIDNAYRQKRMFA